MSIRDKLDRYADEFAIDLLVADGFDDAIVGVGEQFNGPPLVVYNRKKCVEILMERDGMDFNDAIDYMSHNVYGAWVGASTPFFMNFLEDIDV